MFGTKRSKATSVSARARNGNATVRPAAVPWLLCLCRLGVESAIQARSCILSHASGAADCLGKAPSHAMTHLELTGEDGGVEGRHSGWLRRAESVQEIEHLRKGADNTDNKSKPHAQTRRCTSTAPTRLTICSPSSNLTHVPVLMKHTPSRHHLALPLGSLLPGFGLNPLE